MKVGKPIIHRQAYSDLVEGQLRIYLWEAVFGPLFQLLRENQVETDADYQEIGSTPQLKNASDWTLFNPEWQSLGKEREEMPQIDGEDREELIRFLYSRSIDCSEGTILPADLRPAQEGYWPDKVDLALEHAGPERPILVSSDWYILDGHHQWVAALFQPKERMAVVVFDARIEQLLNAARAFPLSKFKNAQADRAVADALRSGRIWYADGKFSGRFNAALSRQLREIGAKWDRTERTFGLSIDQVPMDLRTAVAESQEASATLHKQTATLLSDMEQAIPTASAGLQYGKAVDKITSDLQKQFVRTVPALESISVPVVITPEMRAAISAELTNNLELYIKKFAAAEIPELRGLVERNAFAGGRTPTLARIIEARWGVSKRKAKFLADQETSLLVSKYREQTYKRIGVRRYMWSTAGDSRVRPTRPGETNNHRRLDGKIFAWDAPPVVDTGTGKRCHPGQDFGCRCTAVPVLELPGVTVLP